MSTSRKNPNGWRRTSKTMGLPAKGIFLRYLKVLSTLVAVAIVSIGAVQVVISYRDETRRIDQVQQAEARATASRIDEYLKSIERQNIVAVLGDRGVLAVKR